MTAKHVRYLSWLVVAAIPTMAAGFTARTVQLALSAEIDGEVGSRRGFSGIMVPAYSGSYTRTSIIDCGPGTACGSPSLAGNASGLKMVPPPALAGVQQTAEELEDLVARYNQMLDEKRYEELPPIVERAEAIAADEPVVQTMRKQVQVFGNLLRDRNYPR